MQQIVAVKVVDPHGTADIVQRLRRGSAGFFAPGAQNLVYFRQTRRPVLPPRANGRQLRLQHVIQEFFDRDVAQSAALVMGFQFCQICIFG